MVLQLLHSELELAVKAGFVYLPLLFDPDIAREIQERCSPKGSLGSGAPAQGDTLIELGGRPFIKSVDMHSVLANYERINEDFYEQLKRETLRQSSYIPSLEVMSPQGRLQTILLKIMPYFMRQRRGIKRRQLNDEELVDLIWSKIGIPESYIELAENVLDAGPLLRRLEDLGKLERTMEPLQEGPTTGEVLNQWLRRALEVQIVEKEKARIEQEIRERAGFGASKKKQLAALLYIAEKGSLELDGFGFSKLGTRDDYLVYKRTGEYILKDYYGRSYRFPDCRVAVSTRGPMRPIVVESYKHPFLLNHAPKQEICLTDYDWPDEFTANNVIKLLEDGINALLYGYDARRRNGYHSLDPTLYYVKTIEFVDYRV